MRDGSIAGGGVRVNASSMAYVTNSMSSSSTLTTPVMTVTGPGSGGAKPNSTEPSTVASPLTSPSRKRSIESISTPSCLSYCSTNTTASGSSSVNQQSPYHARPNPALASSAKGALSHAGANLYHYEDDGRCDDDSTEELSLRHMLAFSFSGESPDDEWLIPTPRAQNLTAGDASLNTHLGQGQQPHCTPHQTNHAPHFGHSSPHSQQHHQQQHHQHHHHNNRHHLQQRHQHHHHHHHKHQYQHHHHQHHQQQDQCQGPHSAQNVHAHGTSNSSSTTPNLRYRAYQPDIVSSIFRR